MQILPQSGYLGKSLWQYGCAQRGGKTGSGRKMCSKRQNATKHTGKKNGGITVEWWEALLQIDFLLELFTLAKKEGIHTCLDTSGNPFTTEEPFFSKFEKLMEVTDLVMLDIKEMDAKDTEN